MPQSELQENFARAATRHGYAIAPAKLTRMPGGIPYIVGNEAAERFSYYGMRSILVIFMTQYMLDRHGLPDHLTGGQAKVWFHLFVSVTYFLPLLGGIIADAFWGKYRTIITLSLVYCAGHAVLALDDTRSGLLLGLGLIALGAGGIKPCVSAHVGDQFGASNQHLIPKVFAWFYFSINFGSFISTLLIPVILDRYGSHYAFAIPGILMFIATLVFWLGRKKFAHLPPGGVEFIKECYNKESLKILARLFVIYIFVGVYWSLYDQSASAWVLQAEKMDRHWLGVEWLSSQLQAVNPILILVFIPIFSYAIYPAIDKFFPLTALRKIGIGFFITVASFLVSAWIEARISQGGHPPIRWQILAWVLLTISEIFVSITCLEFSYTQAPKQMKSLIMSLFLLSVTLGDLFTALVNEFIQNPNGTSKLPGAQYYLFFAGLMFVASVIYIFVAQAFKEQTFIQDEA